MSRKEFALIVAGGRGTRINSRVPKQFLEIEGKPVVVHTVEAFRRYSKDLTIVLILPPAEVAEWQLPGRYDLGQGVVITSGGETRFQSVRNGLASVSDDGLVAIHDGVRPLVSVDMIAASFRLAALHGSAVAAVRLKESIRVTDQDTTQAVDRSKYRLIQTPQTFDAGLIKAAYQIKEDPTLTDDASVAERAGHRISLFEGSFENIKITTAEDLIIAEALLKAKSRLAAG